MWLLVNAFKDEVKYKNQAFKKINIISNILNKLNQLSEIQKQYPLKYVKTL